MKDGEYMRAYEKYKLISTIDENLFEPIMEEPDEETGDFKPACEHLIWFHNIIENKIELLQADGQNLLDDETPEVLEMLFDYLDEVKTEHALFVLEGLEAILFDRILYTMNKGLENGSITKDDLESPEGSDL